MNDRGQEFERLVITYLHDSQYTTATQATCNVVFAVINAGVVMLPFAASASGIILYSICIIGASLFSGYTSVMLVKMANDRAVRSYEELGELALGIKGYYALLILQASFSWLSILM